jgi:hypothetical protein
MSKSLFEYAAIHTPKKVHRDDPEPESVLLFGPKAVLSASAETAAMAAAREIPTELADKLDEVKIRVRPF